MKIVQLRELADLQNGYAFKSTDYIDSSNTLNFRMSNIRPGGFSDVYYNPKYLPDDFVDKYKEFLLKDGDVVIAMTDMANEPKILGVPTIVYTHGKNLLLNQRVGKFINVNDKEIYLPFLKYFLSTNKVKGYYKSLGGGGLQINISKSSILSIEIPLPTVENQKKIVKTLDKANDLREKRLHAITLIENYIRAMFLEKIGDPITNDHNFTMVKLGEISTIVRGSSPRPQGDPRYYGGPVPRLMVRDVTRDGRIVTPRIDTLTLEGASKSRPIKKGTVVMAVSGEVGLTSILAVDACIHDGFIAFKELDENLILADILVDLLNILKVTHDTRKVGAIFKNLTTDQIKNMEIPIPPMELQVKINDLRQKIELVRSQMFIQLEKLEIQCQALMQKSFQT